jgi:hypothetical protein
MTLPRMSEIDTIVVLNVAWMCARPDVLVRLTRFFFGLGRFSVATWVILP